MPNNGKAANSSSEAKKTVESQTAARSTVRSSPRRRNNVKSTNTNSPTTSGIRQAPKAANEPTKPADKQHVSDPEVEGYTAPNGTHLRKDELDKLSMGVKVPDKDTVYFHPSFVEDSWKGLKPVMMECSGRWWLVVFLLFPSIFACPFPCILPMCRCPSYLSGFYS